MPQRGEAEHCVREFAIRRVHVSIYRSGLDQVHGDPARAEFPRQAAREGGQSGLRHRVGRDAGEGDTIANIRAYGDDAAAGLQMWNGSLGGEQGRAHVHVQQRVDVVQARVHERAHARDAGVVHEDVETAERLYGLFDGALHGSRICAVRLDGHGATALLLQLADQFGRAIGGVLVGDGDVRTLFRQCPRDARADATGCAGHQRAFSIQVDHRVLLCRIL